MKNNFGQRIRSIRQEYTAQGGTVSDLALLLGVSRSTIYRWEKRTGRKLPRALKLKDNYREYSRAVNKFIKPIGKNLLNRPQTGFQTGFEFLKNNPALKVLLDKKGIEYNDFFRNYYNKIRQLMKRRGSDKIITTQSITFKRGKINVNFKYADVGNLKNFQLSQAVIDPTKIEPVW